jgi:conserved oligomeric Golgi complex subunit 8
MEFLEVPQLVETCVRNSNYDEALDLISSISKMSVVHPDIVAVQHLVAEVAECRSRLVEQLLSKLSSSISLPECLRCVSYIRRVAVFSESELCHRFLECRESWCSLSPSCRMFSWLSYSH